MRVLDLCDFRYIIIKRVCSIKMLNFFYFVGVEPELNYQQDLIELSEVVRVHQMSLSLHPKQ